MQNKNSGAETQPNSAISLVYPVRECSAACRKARFSHARAGFKASREFSNWVYYYLLAGIALLVSVFLFLPRAAYG